ncbi:MAG: PHP domain-containing protein [Bacillota bacterium]
MSADLHLHTTASDGQINPEETVKIAYKRGLKTISITDHDTIAGVNKAFEASRLYGINLISGIEINTDYKAAEVHVLGYFINQEDPDLLALINKIKVSRIERAKKMLIKINDLTGKNLKFKELNKMVRGKVITRAHLARFLVKNNIVIDEQLAFSNYIGTSAPAYVKRDYITTPDAIDVIKQAGGIPVLAHPGRTEYINFDLSDLLNFNFQGIEVYYPHHTQKQTKKFLRIALENDLYVTAGSDNHGPGKGYKNMIGEVRLPRRFLNRLLQVHRP